jgi:hypothetical protein
MQISSSVANFSIIPTAKVLAKRFVIKEDAKDLS